MNSCIHSDSNAYSGGDTVWYNYTVASAGTIIDENTSSSSPATNINTATESICPNGWTLPTTKQIDNNRNTTEFSPVLGGRYYNGNLSGPSSMSRWWGSGVGNNVSARYILGYENNILNTFTGNRRNGLYIRCVSEEKAITSLTYMQDMTHSGLFFKKKSPTKEIIMKNELKVNSNSFFDYLYSGRLLLKQKSSSGRQFKKSQINLGFSSLPTVVDNLFHKLSSILMARNKISKLILSARSFVWWSV